MVKFILKVGK